ncbi:hypothetical protein D3C85_293230 [compost metagenome]
MTSKQPQPMPEDVVRPKAPVGPNVVQFKQKTDIGSMTPKQSIASYEIKIETERMDDGSIWWRINSPLWDGKKNDWTEWESL